MLPNICFQNTDRQEGSQIWKIDRTLCYSSPPARIWTIEWSQNKNIKLTQQRGHVIVQWFSNQKHTTRLDLKMSKVNMAANVEALYNRRSERWRSSRNGHLSSTDVTLCATFKQRSRECALRQSTRPAARCRCGVPTRAIQEEGDRVASGKAVGSLLVLKHQTVTHLEAVHY